MLAFSRKGQGAPLPDLYPRSFPKARWEAEMTPEIKGRVGIKIEAEEAKNLDPALRR